MYEFSNFCWMSDPDLCEAETCDSSVIIHAYICAICKAKATQVMQQASHGNILFTTVVPSVLQ